MMSRFRGVLFFGLLGAITLAALLTWAPSSGPAEGDRLALPFVAAGEPEESEAGPRPEENLPPPSSDSPAALPTAALPEGEPSPTPPAVYAAELDLSGSGAARPAAGAAAGQDDWNPPSLPVPLARHPYDHYWLIRPVTSDSRNRGLEWYPYGSIGPEGDLRIHHGIDISNPVGVEVLAAGDGTVVWAGRGHHNQYESITAYGNTISIEHDFGYQGKKVYTLYAHLSAILVEAGQRVQAGELIGLIGATGQVSGPHVHFEVRIDRNSYYAVRNPELWMAPYVGTGVIAGRVAFPDGRLAENVPVVVRSLETGQVTHRVPTYAGFGVNADDNWNENFVVADVPVGNYLVSASYGTTRWIAEVEVQEGMTNWVNLAAHTAASSEPEPTATPQPQAEDQTTPDAP